MGAEKVSHFERWGFALAYGGIPGGGVGRHLQLVLLASLVKNVLEGLHSTLVGGHMGAAKTLEKVRARFYWPGQRNDVDMWCRKCAICNSCKAPPGRARPLWKSA